MNNIEYRNWVKSNLDINNELLYLTQKDCRNAGLTDEDILKFTADAMVAYSSKKAEMPAKIGIHPLKDTLMHAMPAYIPEHFSCGIKWASFFPENRKLFCYF